MGFEEIDQIVILVQLKNGNAHQVLTSKTNKEIALGIINMADNGLKLDSELEPIEFKKLTK